MYVTTQCAACKLRCQLNSYGDNCTSLALLTLYYHFCQAWQSLGVLRAGAAIHMHCQHTRETAPTCHPRPFFCQIACLPAACGSTPSYSYVAAAWHATKPLYLVGFLHMEVKS
jgi:hypothetical protein